MGKSGNSEENSRIALHIKILYGSLTVNFAVSVFMIIILYKGQECDQVSDPMEWSDQERFRNLHVTTTSADDDNLKWIHRFRRRSDYVSKICFSEKKTPPYEQLIIRIFVILN